MTRLMFMTEYKPSDLCLQRVKKVIGIELCQEAVEDAKVNTKLNGRTPAVITLMQLYAARNVII